MKKFNFGLLAIMAVVLTVLFSCKDHFLSEPKIPSGGGSAARGLAPEGLYASQGEKRAITLSWVQKTDAELYYIYKADSPLDTFIRCGETASNQIKFNVAPGSIVYYRVSSVSLTGKESPQSAYVKGTSLAQPIITDIADITESSAEVTWYMDNVSEDTYKNNLLYTVYCYNGVTEVAQIALDGSVISENRAVFSGLNANTHYEYVVEAYLRSDQNASEKSDKMDAATARRFRPGHPEKLRAARGAAIDKVELSFELPDMVDIALGDNQYDPKPVYFVISRRLYSENHSNEYMPVCLYFGSITDKAKNPEDLFSEYIPGTVVNWTDEKVTRGIVYEYQVQSYVDGTPKVISSDTSKSSASGWAMSEGSLSFGKPVYTLNANGDFYTSAKLPLDFRFDPKGVRYEYVFDEWHTPVDEAGEVIGAAYRNSGATFTNYDVIRAYTFDIVDLDSGTGERSPRGLYSYSVVIKLDGESIETIKTFGEIEITENTNPIVVDDFYVQDGFKDKFVLRWKNQSDMKYTLYQSNDRSVDSWEEIGVVNEVPDEAHITVIENFSYEVTGAIGTEKYFMIQPARKRTDGTGFKLGQKVYAPVKSQTLGIPVLTSANDNASYSFVTVTWKEAQKADTYRIKYWYTGEGDYQTAAIANTVNKNSLVLNADENFRFSFHPDGYDDVARAGLEIQVAVDALNEGLRTEVTEENGSDLGEITTSSAEEVKTRLVGPAQINLSASKAASTTDINVSWDNVSGADGYYVFRRQFNMTNTAEEGYESVVYYVPKTITSSNNLTGKNLALDSSNSKTDTTTVKATAALTGSRYTLTDMFMPDSDYDGSLYNRHTPVYRDQQNDMAQGYPYRYYVVPVISRGGAPESLNAIEFTYRKDGSNKNTAIASYIIRESNTDIRYSGADALELEGFAIGFGQNVTATKGTYASTGNVNNGIKITWSAPPRLSTAAGFTPQYSLYRRISGSSTWESVRTGITATEYVEDPLPARGTAYEYVVSINGSQPQYSRRFIDLCYTLRDEKHRPDMLGFMLEMVKLGSVSKDERRLGNDFAEEVSWTSAGIKNSISNDNNWGLDGYEVFVMNRNIDGEWHKIADVTGTNLIDQINQSVLVTNTMGGGGLLKVMRDYKHYFKVRSYVLYDSDKIYCPDPAYSWSNGGQNDYVKWGARQIGGDEFIRIVTLHMALGIQEVNGTAWNTGNFGRNADASGTNTTGRVHAESNFGVTDWTIDFQNYRDDLQIRTGQWVTFLTLNGKIRPFTNASNQYPQRYGYFDPVAITGPSDTPALYTGTFRFGTGGDLYWDRGTVQFVYPTGNTTQTVQWKGMDTALPYSGQGNYRHDQEYWK